VAAPGPRAPAPRIALTDLRAVWFQLTGTLCNLACRHCFNASGPREPWLRPLAAAVVRRGLREAEALGAREVYFTGGEPLLHPDALSLIEEALAVAPTTVLTNGLLIDDAVADRLVAQAAGSLYSLEIRISLDGAAAEEHDPVRGRGTFGRALAAVRRLDARGLIPIVTATEVSGAAGEPRYDRLRRMLVGAGVTRPRVKMLPVLPLGRAAEVDDGRRLTAEDLEGFDTAGLPCADARVIADGGVYACPILAGLAGARLAAQSLAEALGPASLYHAVCVACRDSGIACRN
jgi:MoaA/NifB/PqqE/SkfB family radical SAM enzyme